LNAQGILQGWTDVPLNQNGIKLAVATGKAMKGVRFDYCISSPLIRARDTATIILRESGNETPIDFDDRIKELHFGKREGTILNKEEAKLFFTDAFSFGRFPGGESANDVCQRTQSFLNELVSRNDDKTYLVSTHGCALRAMLNSLYDNPNDYWHGRVPYNCVVNILSAQDGNVKLIEDDIVFYDQKYCIDRYSLK